jgi:hypothetical protein
MRQPSRIATFGLFCATLFAAPQPQVPAAGAPPAQNPVPQIDLQFLADVLRSAAAFNSAVRSMNIPQTFNPSQNAADGNGRTANQMATALGAGAGVGAAIGSMTGKQKGALIGAAVGSAGAMIIEAIVKHQASATPSAAEENNGTAKPLQQRSPAPEPGH